MIVRVGREYSLYAAMDTVRGPVTWAGQGVKEGDADVVVEVKE